MKKSAKRNNPAKKNKPVKENLPDLVTAMMKLVERLEAIERKMDQVLSRVSNLPSEIRNAVQQIPPSQPSHHVPLSPLPPLNQGPRERILHQAVCADCTKRCEVPFRPSGGRPVYCPECWAIRKAGHVPKDITSGIVVPAHVRELKTPPAPAPKRKKQKTAKKKKK